MPAPWEKYQADSADTPPWVKYGGQAKPEMGWGEYLGRGVTDALPVAAMAGGGLLGGIPGAALGYAGGAEAKGLLNHYAFGDEVPSTKPADQVERVAGNAAEGAAQQLAIPVAGKAAGLLSKAAPKAVAAVTEKVAPAAKRNIVIKPILDALSSYRKMLPETAGQDIDALVTEIRSINKYGKVNPEELAAVKGKIKAALDSEETGPYLRNASVLAQDAAGKIGAPAKRAATSPLTRDIFSPKGKKP